MKKSFGTPDGGKEKRIKALTEEIIKLEDKLWELKKEKQQLKRKAGAPALIFKGSGWAKNDL